MDEVEEIKRKKLAELMAKKEVEKMETKIEVTDKTFEKEVIERSKDIPVMVDFWAPWCAPCLMLGPILEGLASKYKGKLVFAKINVDENPLISRMFNITSIPSVKLFRDGKVADEFVGVVPEPIVEEWIKRNIS